VSGGTPLATLVGTSFGTTPFGINSVGGTWAPDFIAMVRVDQAWGLFQASFAAHDNHATYFTPTLETSGHPGDKWGWAGQLALSIKNIPTGPGDTLNIQGVYTNGASRYNFQDLIPTTFAIYGHTNLPGAFQSIAFASVSDSVFGGTSTLLGGTTEQQLTTTFGMRGGYTHNWDPYWNTSIFGAWAAVRYNNLAKTLICTNIVTIATPGSGFSCNPDFNIAQIGTKTAWTPVKNLTFSGEAVFTELDQKFTGEVTIPAIATIAKPTAIYQNRDQGTWTFLARAQRNW
jgi:hypothetical protein